MAVELRRGTAFEIPRREHITIMLGAGASYDAGLPLARDLFDAEFIEEVHEGARPGGGAERTEALEKALSMAKLVKDNAGDIQRLHRQWIENGEVSSVRDMEEAVCNVMFWAETAAFQRTQRSRAISDVDTVFALAAMLLGHRDSGRGVAVISMNYDFFVEWGLGFARFHYGRITGRMRWPKGFGELLGGGLPAFESGISLLKPHGSLNWLICDVCEHVICGRDNMWAAARGLTMLKKCSDCGHPLRPLFVPPISTSQAPVLKEVWLDIEEMLQRTELFLVVGYSFPDYDHDVRTAVVRGLNKQSTVVIIDPFVFQSPERYAGLTAGPVFGCARNFGEILQAFATGGGILAESLVPLA